MTQKIVFFGSGWFVIPVIKKLSNFDLALVVTNEKEGPVIQFCRDNNISFISSSLKDDEAIEMIKSLNPTIAILASYGAIIPDPIIELFINGILNIHPSLLPKYKGPSPVQYQLLNGETVVGVTIIKLDNQVDHGPILVQKPYNLTGNETAKDLLAILFDIGGDLIEEQITKLENGEDLSETPQDHSRETWSYKITKQDGFIDFYKLQPTNYKLENMIRAFYPWPGVWVMVRIKNQELRIKLLPEGKIQVEGKNPTSYKDFVNGFGKEGRELLEKLKLY